MHYRPHKDGLERYGLGPTEAALMEYLWDCTSGRTLSQVVYYRADGRATTTVQTTLNRLTRKGLLIRSKTDSSHYRYRPAETREVWEARQIAAVQAALEETT
jgi:predicted transcriptional regulator